MKKTDSQILCHHLFAGRNSIRRDCSPTFFIFKVFATGGGMHGSGNLVLSKGSKPILAIEIKHTNNPKPGDVAGLNSIREEYPKLRTVIVTRQDNPRMMGKHESLPYATFLDMLWKRKIL